MPVDPNIHPHWAQETKELAARLDELDYFEVLGVAQVAPIVEIKEQYHSLQRAYHPDTFYQSPDTDLKDAVFRIAKRLSEAYVVLRDPARRARYLKDVSGDERKQKLRFTEESESKVRKDQEATQGQTSQGRNLVAKALKAIDDGDLRSAERDLKTALLFEPKNTSIQSRLELLREQMKSG